MVDELIGIEEPKDHDEGACKALVEGDLGERQPSLGHEIISDKVLIAN